MVLAIVRPAFRALAALRSARAFHPRGALYAGSVLVRGAGPLPLGEHACRVRLSKGIGTPRGVPDLLGIAVRILCEPPVDVLCTTTLGAAGWRRYVLWPTRRWGRSTLTSLMPWRSASGERVQAVVAVADPRLDSLDPDAFAGHLPVHLVLRSAGRDGVAQEGTVLVTDVVTAGSERIAFDPMLHNPPGWRLAPGWLATLRERAYVSSRAGRAGNNQDG
jgi:hypothetical protein